VEDERMRVIGREVIALLVLAGILALAGMAAGGEGGYGVYQYIVRNARGAFDEIGSAIEARAVSEGWEVVAAIDAGVPDDCHFSARVFVLYDSLYAARVIGANPKTGPFAALDRVTVFEDENGLHVSVVNPHSINRTILMDDSAYEEMTASHLMALRKMIAAAVDGETSRTEYGQFREGGYIGKTMGVMAGGKFEDLLREKAGVPGQSYKKVAARVREGLRETSEQWGMEYAYQVDIPEFDMMILGATGTPMDSKSFEIVRQGSDQSREDFECPGIAYAGAYPIEVVVAERKGEVTVYMTDVMYRMKMYFEDAGKWAFMKNMSMPGSIEEEVAEQIENGLDE
jgi:hypothetical protein